MEHAGMLEEDASHSMQDAGPWEATDRHNLYTHMVLVSAGLIGNERLPYAERLATIGTLAGTVAQRIRTISKHSEVALVCIAANAVGMHRESVRTRGADVKVDPCPWPDIQEALEKTGSMSMPVQRDSPFHRLVSKLARIDVTLCPTVWHQMCSIEPWTYAAGTRVIDECVAVAEKADGAMLTRAKRKKREEPQPVTTGQPAPQTPALARPPAAPENTHVARLKKAG